ncbi:DUF4097 family beta strand repeat-containing protein [Aliiglaciecola litoralis]|uniref:DUF4097 domain-containing protein n=1 Tax=Aliiglaciecola litoralis TaxID=582857 RepID=A0ABN1LCR8_9ALTE
MHTLSTPLTMARLMILGATLISLSGCIIHIGGGSNDYEGNSVSSVFGGLSVSSGKQVTNISSVNGSIDLEDKVSAHHVDTVNGSIDIGNHVSVRSAKTVNGNIETGHHFVSKGDVETVNGDISIQTSSTINGNVETVNGDIVLDQIEVKSNVQTHTGDISLAQNTQVHGDIIFNANKQNRGAKTIPTLTIDNTSIVHGQIILHRQVTLVIEDAELLRKVQYYYKNAQ